MHRSSEHWPGDPRRAGHARATPAADHGTPAAPAPQRRGMLHVPEAASIHGAWLIAPMLLLALACGLRLAVRGPDPSFDLCFALLLGMGFAWTTIRLLATPTQPPACPHCKRRALVRMQPQQTIGARCLHCGWRDEAMDSAQLGVLIVLRPHVRGTLHGARPTLGPRELRAKTHDRRDRRPPRGSSGRGRGLR